MFEQLSEDLVRRGILFPGSSYSRLGRWWQKEVEIDLVGLNEVSGMPSSVNVNGLLSTAARPAVSLQHSGRRPAR